MRRVADLATQSQVAQLLQTLENGGLLHLSQWGARNPPSCNHLAIGSVNWRCAVDHDRPRQQVTDLETLLNPSSVAVRGGPCHDPIPVSFRSCRRRRNVAGVFFLIHRLTFAGERETINHHSLLTTHLFPARTSHTSVASRKGVDQARPRIRPGGDRCV
jgi:hypothetical protein